MLVPHGSVFLSLTPLRFQRILQAGKVLTADSQNFVARFDEVALPSSGDQVTVYAETRGKFLEQRAIVVEIRQSEPYPVISFARVGKPMSAELRRASRWRVDLALVLARIGDAGTCQVLDMGPNGFAAIVNEELDPGSTLDVELTMEGLSASATARVQTKLRPPRPSVP